MGIVIALGLLVLLVIAPIGFRLRYDSNGFVIGLILGPATLGLYPRKKTAKSKAKSSEQGTANDSSNKESKSTGGSIGDFREIIERVLEFVTDFRRKVLIQNLKLNLTLAGDDPSDLACNYGRAWATLGNLIPLLEQSFNIRKRDLSVNCDFMADKTVVCFYGVAIIPIYRLLQLAGVHGIKILRSYFKLKKLRKGGNAL